MRKKVLLVGGGLVLLVMVGMGLKMAVLTADIRPESVRAGFDDAAKTEGRAWLAKSAAAHGGLDRWRTLRDGRFVLTDTWHGLMGMMQPWPEDGQRLELALLNGRDNGRLTHLGGPSDGLVWGIQNWVTWQQPKGGEPVYAPDDDVKFWVPTISYFVELPFRLPEAEIAVYAGDETIFGRPHARVYVTWGTAEPQDEIDQYVVYIDRETHLVGTVFYTVRDMMSGVTGAMRYEDYRDVDGLKVAFKMTSTETPTASTVIHRMVIEEGRFGVGKPDAYYVPDPKRTAQK